MKAKKVEKEWLMDVVAIRIILIVLLVLYHAFCPFTGGWTEPYDGFSTIEIYKIFGLFIHQGQLEGMTFISGLLLGFGLNNKNNNFDFLNSVAKKAKRILLPCFYLVLFITCYSMTYMLNGIILYIVY